MQNTQLTVNNQMLQQADSLQVLDTEEQHLEFNYSFL